MSLPEHAPHIHIPNIMAAITGRRGGQSAATLEAPPLPVPAEEGTLAPHLPPEEPENPGRRRFLAALTGGAIGVAIEATPARHLVNPLFEKALAWWNSVVKTSEASQGDVFNPKAKKGEIGNKNSISIPLNEASRIAYEKSVQDKKVYFVVPKSKEPINYRIETQQPTPGENISFIKTSGFSEGDRISTLYGGKLRLTEYDAFGGVPAWMRVEIRDIEFPNGIKGFITLSGNKNTVQFLMDRSLFNFIPFGSNGRISSDIAIKPGQDIFRIIGQGDTDYQVIFAGAASDGGQNSFTRVGILPADNKAVVTPSSTPQ